MRSLALGAEPIVNREAERAVIGTAFMARNVAERLATEEGLRPHHFWSETHRAVWSAITAAQAAGEEPEVRLVAERLDRQDEVETPGQGWQRLLEDCVADTVAPGNVRTYARQVVNAWRYEHRRRALLDALLAVEERDEGGFVKAIQSAENTATRAHGPNLTDPQKLADHIASWLAEPREAGLPMPWPRLGRVLKLRPSQTTVLAGWTSIGKSMVALHLGAFVGSRGLRSVVWSNEMSEHEIVTRHITRETGANYEQIMDGKIPERDIDMVMEALKTLPFGVQPCHGWPAVEVAAHIRAVKPDLAVLDHFHAIPGVGRVEDADEALTALIAAAGQSGSHLVLVAQLNQARNQGVLRQPPVLRDLRGTGNLFNLPNNVLFVHRREEMLVDEHDNELGQANTTNEGHFDVAKQRGGQANETVAVTFNPYRMRFLEAAA